MLQGVLMRYLLFSLLLASPAVFANETHDLTHRFGIGGGGGWAFPILGNDFDDAFGDDLTYNLHMRYHTSQADSLQLNYQNYEFEDTDLGANVYDLMWINRINEHDKLTPIFGLGAGVADMRNMGRGFQDNLKFAGRARLGMEYALTDDLFASATVDYQYIGKMPHSGEDENDEDRKIPGQELHALVPQINLTLFFGPDKEDKNSTPAAAAAPDASATPAATDPAMMDADKDGVVDGKDKCSGTGSGLTVNAYGCVPEEKANIEVEGVMFDSGSSKMTSGSDQSMSELAAFLKEHPETKAEIQGHTDNTGSKPRNKTLSQERAEAVKSYLVEKHQIEPGRLSAYGYGDAQPVSDNTTTQGRSENRRVMAIISQ